jgi:hypothetical protein
MNRIAQTGAPLALVVAVATACGGSGDSSGETRAMASATVAAAPVARRVSSVMIGKRIGAGNRMTDPTFQFAPQDTVFLSVGTEGTSGPTSLMAAWRSQTGQVVQQTTEFVRTGGENTAFHLAQPKGLKPGTYKVILFLGDDSVDTKVFVVKK